MGEDVEPRRKYIEDHALDVKNLDVDLGKTRMEVEGLVKSGPEMVSMGKLPRTPRGKKVLGYAIEEAKNLGHNYVGTEHLLLGLLREGEGVAAQVLMNMGLMLDEVRKEVLHLLGAGDSAEGEAAEARRQIEEVVRARLHLPAAVRRDILTMVRDARGDR